MISARKFVHYIHINAGCDIIQPNNQWTDSVCYSSQYVWLWQSSKSCHLCL